MNVIINIIMRNIGVLKLYEPKGRNRDFDAADENEIINGVVQFVPDAFDEPRTYIFIDRTDPLGDSYAMKHGGGLEEIADDQAVTDMVVKALRSMPTRSRGQVSAWDRDGEIDLSKTMIDISPRRRIHE